MNVSDLKKAEVTIIDAADAQNETVGQIIKKGDYLISLKGNQEKTYNEAMQLEEIFRDCSAKSVITDTLCISPV